MENSTTCSNVVLDHLIFCFAEGGAVFVNGEQMYIRKLDLRKGVTKANETLICVDLKSKLSEHRIQFVGSIEQLSKLLE